MEWYNTHDIVDMRSVLIALVVLPSCAFGFYSPSIGRWQTPDPIEEEGGKNLYAFCRNAATFKYDILGERTDVGSWRLMNGPLDAEYHNYNCIEFGGRGTKDKYLEHFLKLSFAALPTRYRSVFSYNLINQLGMDGVENACWCLVLSPFQLYTRVVAGAKEFQLRTRVKVLDKHENCCPEPEIQMSSQIGRKIVLGPL